MSKIIVSRWAHPDHIHYTPLNAEEFERRAKRMHEARQKAEEEAREK